MGLLNFDFSGDLIARMEAFDREQAQYEQASGKTVSDGIRIGVVLQRLEESALKLLKAEGLSRSRAARPSRWMLEPLTTAKGGKGKHKGSKSKLPARCAIIAVVRGT